MLKDEYIANLCM